MEEIWKDIEGYEGLYQISSQGRVKSLDYGLRGYPQCLVPKISNKGYHQIILAKNSVKKSHLIHRLVANAFIPNPDNLPLINHKDENKQNNSLENLEWCTAAYNVRYSLERCSEPPRRVRGPRGISNAWKYGKTQIVQTTLDGEVVKVWDGTTELVAKTSWNTWSVTQCCLGSRKTAYGFKWHFADTYTPGREAGI